jgi:DNA-directed RNA polymerase III subunit RPC1
VLLDEEKRRSFLRRLRNPNLDSLQRRMIVKAIQDECKKVVYCPHCQATNGECGLLALAIRSNLS